MKNLKEKKLNQKRIRSMYGLDDRLIQGNIKTFDESN